MRQLHLSEFPRAKARVRRGSAAGEGLFCPRCGVYAPTALERREHAALHRGWKYRGLATCARDGGRAHYWDNTTYHALACPRCGDQVWEDSGARVIHGIEATAIVRSLVDTLGRSPA